MTILARCPQCHAPVAEARTRSDWEAVEQLSREDYEDMIRDHIRQDHTPKEAR